MNEKVNKRDLRCTSRDDMMKSVDMQMQQEMEKMRRDLILKNHPYEIYYSTDGRWHTYVMDGSKRRLIAKKNKEAVEDAIVKFYKDNDIRFQCTLKSLYPEWLEYKSAKCSPNSVSRIECDWKKYYANSDIVDIPITKLDYLTLDNWAHRIIMDHELTQKQYTNLSIIMRQSLDYAIECKYINVNPFTRVKVSGKCFSKTQKKASATQVFLTDEQCLIEAEAYEDFNKTGNVVCLAIPLGFQTGLRLGELVALRFSDIDGDYLHVQRMERISKNKSGMWDYKVVQHTKSAAGYRSVPLTPKAKEIFEMIKKSQDESGVKDEDFIFVNKVGRVHKRAIDTRIRKYCDHCKIPQKNMHKVRKTFISTLIDARLNINFIREIIGHESEQTTYKNYCYNRLPETETFIKFEKALTSV